MARKQKITVVNVFTYKPEAGVKIKGKSMTVPGEAMSVKEMLYKFQNGTLDRKWSDLQYYEELDDVPFEQRPGWDLSMIDDAKAELELLSETIKQKSGWDKEQQEPSQDTRELEQQEQQVPDSAKQSVKQLPEGSDQSAVSEDS